MDPNSPSSSNPPQVDTPPSESTQPIPTPPQDQNIQTPPVTNDPVTPTVPVDPNPVSQSEPTKPTDPASQNHVVTPNSPLDSQTTEVQQNTNTGEDSEQENYDENVGGDAIGLLDEISTDQHLLQEVADEMQLDPEKVTSILTTLLDKIDQGQVTAEEIALILASTVADELTNDEEIL